MKHILTMMAALLLLAACGQSYEETKRITRQQQREAARQDSAALKIAVVPTLDCLPLYVARHLALFDTLYGGVRLKPFAAQMDCDEALAKGRVEGMVSDLVRVAVLNRRGIKMRSVAATNAYWQLVANRNARIRQLKQLDGKMIAMTRYSATDLLSDRAVDTVRLQPDRVFKVQINDVHVRLQMLQNNEMDALWLTEPLATVTRMQRHGMLMDTRQLNLQLGVLAFREQEMRRPERTRQLDLLVKAYNQACDSINKYGVAHYRDLIATYCGVKQAMVDSLPEQQFLHARGPRQQDIAVVDKWLDKRSEKPLVQKR